ncbi:hypothetical protein GQ53DRAFT_880494 [Thozetella sp. PMI_491]|nr:hypothetical protein GQ53DRAFT_880494 [Thozetella sp. PMI_491]
MHLSMLAGRVGLLASVVLAAPYVQETRQVIETRQGCTFDSLNHPECWQDGLDIKANYYKTWPAGTTTTYDFTISEATLAPESAPDGVGRTVIAVNGQIPGPKILANWGDTVVVNVKNNMKLKGTSIHFHGVRQLNSNDQDGVVGITQCPTAPQDTITYTWKATQYGTSWYHSHYGMEAWDGVFGPIQILGPASSKYDTDLGPVMLSDWTHKTTDELHAQAFRDQTTAMDNGLINGLNMFGDKGKYYSMTFKSKQKHRIRLINTALDTFFHVSLEGHEMTVIAADFVPIEPFTVGEKETLRIGHGQRYDVIIEATKDSGDYWFHGWFSSCGSTGQDIADSVRAVVHYGDSTALPTAPPADPPIAFADRTCTDMEAAKLKPIVPLEFATTGVEDHSAEWAPDNNNPAQEWHWLIQNKQFRVDWSSPTLLQIKNTAAGQPLTFQPEQQVVSLSGGAGQFVRVTIINEDAAHPIHLHGHDFYVLRQDDAGFDPNDTAVKTQYPPRRDVAMLPTGGRLIIGFETDNPGVWLLHCHIGWHTTEGFALQFHERLDEFRDPKNPAFPNGDRLSTTCNNWQKWATSNNIVQDDSGI